MFYLIQLVIIHYSASTQEFLKFYREREHKGAYLNFLSQLWHRTPVEIHFLGSPTSFQKF